MTTFAGKVPPSSQKLRGGYYTPEAIARFLADWVAPAGPRVLEPSCGNGAILRFLSGDVTGIELEPDEAAQAKRAAPEAHVHTADLFDWFGSEQFDRWDAVAGNPPFIRFQYWTEPTRSAAFDLMREVGLRPTKLTNAWVPFVVASTMALREGGRLGLVIPAELLQVTYAAQLREFLIDKYAELTTVMFKRLLFDGVQQETVLLLGVRGDGPARIRAVETEDAQSLPTPDVIASVPHAPALRHDSEKWIKYLLEPSRIEALRRARAHPGVVRLGELVDVDVGVVTGRNKFFVLRRSGVDARMLHPHVRPLVSRSAHVQGTEFSGDDLAALDADDAQCHLLAIDAAFEPDTDPALDDYIAAGEEQNVHTGYKCSIRKRWWVVPSTWTPDAFLLRQIHQHPKIIANRTGATATDTVHRIRLLNGTRPSTLAAASINTLTFAFAEVMGRSYGGGVLELEPREAEALPFPDPHRLSPDTAVRVDGLVREGRVLEALDVVDHELLIDGLGIKSSLVAELRGVWERLRDRRLRRN